MYLAGKRRSAAYDIPPAAKLQGIKKADRSGRYPGILISDATLACPPFAYLAFWLI
jgi:hypothetical protein